MYETVYIRFLFEFGSDERIANGARRKARSHFSARWLEHDFYQCRTVASK
jgi:hypothetical protein